MEIFQRRSVANRQNLSTHDSTRERGERSSSRSSSPVAVALGALNHLYDRLRRKSSHSPIARGRSPSTPGIPRQAARRNYNPAQFASRIQPVSEGLPRTRFDHDDTVELIQLSGGPEIPADLFKRLRDAAIQVANKGAHRLVEVNSRPHLILNGDNDDDNDSKDDCFSETTFTTQTSNFTAQTSAHSYVSVPTRCQAPLSSHSWSVEAPANRASRSASATCRAPSLSAAPGATELSLRLRNSRSRSPNGQITDEMLTSAMPNVVEQGGAHGSSISNSLLSRRNQKPLQVTTLGFAR